MNTDGDIECTCDVGVFASCPVCSNYTPALNGIRKDDYKPMNKQASLSYLDMYNLGKHGEYK